MEFLFEEADGTVTRALISVDASPLGKITKKKCVCVSVLYAWVTLFWGEFFEQPLKTSFNMLSGAQMCFFLFFFIFFFLDKNENCLYPWQNKCAGYVCVCVCVLVCGVLDQ